MIKIIFLFLIVILFSCSNGYGDKVSDKNVIVYFLEKNHKETAQKLLDFWIKEGFNSDKIQSLRILKFNKETVDLQLIASESSDPKSMSFEELKLFIELKTQLDSAVFKPQTCRIVICDGSFNPLFTPTN